MRERHGLFACSGIIFNHESPRRPPQFVRARITRGAAAIRLGLESELVLGDLAAVRDWSHADDACRRAARARPGGARRLRLASGRAGRSRTSRVAFAYVGLDPSAYVRVDADLVRAPEPTPQRGRPLPRAGGLGWRPRWSFEALVGQMVDADLAALRA